MHFFAFAIPGLGPISQFFAGVLKFLNSFTGNLALSIILLTVIFRVVVLPLSFKQTKSMIAMQKLQPQLKEIQKKYKDDREKQGQEMMKLYKENKVSPLGGCLPLLIQLPILFALFDVLHNMAKYMHSISVTNVLKYANHTATWVRGSSKYAFLGIGNVVATGKTMWSGGTISIYDPAKHAVVAKVDYPGGEYTQVIILILLTVATGYISAKMMVTDPKQSKMMALMPLLMGFFAWILPAGVTIYIIVTNILTFVQQYVQLECEGFYDERIAQKKKTGDGLSTNDELKEKIRMPFAKALVAVRLKKVKPRESGAGKEGKKIKAPATKGQKEKNGKGEGTEKAKEEAGVPAPEKKKPEKKDIKKEEPEKKEWSNKGDTKNYPAKKKTTKKK